MTLVDHRPVRDIRAGWWTYGIGELARAGVQLDPLVAQLLTDPDIHETLIMAAWPLPDPWQWFGYDETPCPPLEVWPEGYGRPTRPTIPVIADIDWSLGQELEVHYGPVWRRFPSFPVRVIVPDSYNESEARVRFVRAWDAAVIREEEIRDVVEAGAEVWQQSNYKWLRMFHESRRNDLDDCELALEYGLDSSAHTHRVEVLGAASWKRCLDGENVYSELERELFRGGDISQPREFPFEPAFVEPETVQAWESLTLRSQAAAEQALLVAPPWDVDALRRSEQEAGRPWW